MVFSKQSPGCKKGIATVFIAWKWRNVHYKIYNKVTLANLYTENNVKALLTNTYIVYSLEMN